MIKEMLKDNISVIIKRRFQNVRGEHIHVKFVQNNLFTRVILRPDRNDKLYRKSLALLFVVTINLVSLINRYLPMILCAAIFLLGLLLLYSFMKNVKQESLLIIKPLGYQLDIKYTFGRKTTFIPWHLVQGVFINEVISRFKVIYVMALLTKDSSNEEKIIPIFNITQPRLDCLQLIYEHLYDI